MWRRRKSKKSKNLIKKCKAGQKSTSFFKTLTYINSPRLKSSVHNIFTYNIAICCRNFIQLRKSRVRSIFTNYSLRLHILESRRGLENLCCISPLITVISVVSKSVFEKQVDMENNYNCHLFFRFLSPMCVYMWQRGQECIALCRTLCHASLNRFCQQRQP